MFFSSNTQLVPCFFSKDISVKNGDFMSASILSGASNFGNRMVPSLKLTANAPENGWLEYDPFLLGVCLFSGANC